MAVLGFCWAIIGKRLETERDTKLAVDRRARMRARSDFAQRTDEHLCSAPCTHFVSSRLSESFANSDMASNESNGDGGRGDEGGGRRGGRRAGQLLRQPLGVVDLFVLEPESVFPFHLICNRNTTTLRPRFRFLAPSFLLLVLFPFPLPCPSYSPSRHHRYPLLESRQHSHSLALTHSPG